MQEYIFYFQNRENQHNTKRTVASVTDYNRITSLSDTFHASIYSLSAEPTKDPEHDAKIRYLGDLWLDIDHKGNDAIALSIEDIRKIKSYLISINVDIYACELFISGGKGFHLRIPLDLMSGIASNDLPEIHKGMALRIAERTGVTTGEDGGIDPALFAKGQGQLLRVACKKRANGYYKVPITWDEFDQLTPESYFELAAAPRPSVKLNPPVENQELINLYSDAMRDVIHKKNTATTTFSNGEIKKICGNKIPNCWKTVESGVLSGDGKSNLLGLAIARCAVEFDVNTETACINNATQGTPPAEFKSRVKSAINSVKSQPWDCRNIQFLPGFKKSTCNGCPVLKICKRNELVDKISCTKRHLQALKKALKAEPNNLDLGRTLAKCLALKSPAKITIENAVKFVCGHCKSMSENEARELIAADVSTRATAVLQRNKLNAEVNPTLCDEMSPIDIAQFIYDKSIATWNFTGETEQIWFDEYQYNIQRVENKKKMIFDPRGMASGKTKAMAELVKLAKESGHDISILYLTHRVGLTKGAAVQLDILDYQDVGLEEYGSVRQVATCVNSAPKFTQNFKVVFVDEARQTLETLYDSPLIGDKVATIKDIEKKVREADLVIVADADLNDFTFEKFKSFGGNKHEVTVLQNSSKAPTATHTLLESHDHSRKLLLKLVQEGQRGTVACTSEGEVRNTVTYLKKFGIKSNRILTLTGENKGDAKPAAFLLNPTEQAANYDVVIHTSVIGSGVSIEYQPFNFAFLLNSCVLPSNEVSQMWSRNRCATYKYLSFGAANNNEKPADVEAFYDFEFSELDNLAQQFKKIAENKGFEGLYDPFTGRPWNEMSPMAEPFKPSQFTQSRAEVIASRNADLNDYENNLVLFLEMNGIELVRPKCEVFGSLEKSEFRKVKQETLDQTVQDRLNAEIISYEAAKKLKETTALTQEQSNSIRRATTVEMAGTPEIAEADILFEHRRGFEVVLNHEFLSKSEADLLESDFKNFKTKNRLGSQVLLQRVLLEVLGVLQGEEEVMRNTAHKACSVLKKNHKVLSVFANYNKPKFEQPVRTLQNLLRKYGYDLVKIGRESTGWRQDIYQLKIMDEVALYTSNRATCSRS